ncbi:hypothetical protein G3O08_04395 [Cryomorpha ignava]|uniref:Outer membrane protein beta-barrel domain-containing protein n=1 Tax=Cryomorpha ignava TaxID=101383 RepID=A0A7K3WPQ9_9FLAO|nr:hypothetical protein [Cryomorpha ignava]NEN22745.1 hypothetical protein [Cryomorpha ignava]
MSKCFKYCGIVFLMVFESVFFSNVLFGQMYFQGNLQYSIYNHHKPLDLVDVNPDLTFGLGVMIFANQKSKFEIGAELNSFHRNFYQKYDEADYKYIFRGLDLRLLTNYSISEKWNLTTGVVAATYFPEIRMNGEYIVEGEGFRESDYGVFIGCHYYLTKSWVLGARFDFWFVNMLEYQLIGDYGDLQPKVKDIRANTAEVFLRYQFFNRWK